MNRTFCLNMESLPASDRNQARELFQMSIAEALRLRQGKDDRFNIIFDSSKDDSFLSISLTHDYSIEDFLRDLEADGERETCELLFEMFDKGPAIAALSDEELDELGSVGFYFEDLGYTHSIDALAIAWFFEATLLSLNTDARWERCRVEFAKYDQTGAIERFSVPNVSRTGHAEELSKVTSADSLDHLKVTLDQCVLSSCFSEWYAGLDAQNRRRLAAKLQLAHARAFEGGKPLFETLKGANGMRELRVPFFPGGAIRVLFDGMRDGRIAILVGFVKKSDGEGYDTYIPQASAILAAL